MYDLAKESVLRLFRAPIEPPDAPAGDYADVRVMRASPKLLTYNLLWVWIGGALLALFVVGSGVGGIFAPPLLILTALGLLLFFPILLVRYFCVRVDYDLRYYILTDRSVRVRQGAWLVEEKTITYANVQNVRVEQGPLQRMFGFSSVRIDTAGGGMVQAGNHSVAQPHGVTLAGIENAAQVRDSILEAVRRRTDAGLGDGDEPDARADDGWSRARLEALREVAFAARTLKLAAVGSSSAPPPVG